MEYFVVLFGIRYDKSWCERRQELRRVASAVQLAQPLHINHSQVRVIQSYILTSCWTRSIDCEALFSYLHSLPVAWRHLDLKCYKRLLSFCDDTSISVNQYTVRNVERTSFQNTYLHCLIYIHMYIFTSLDKHNYFHSRLWVPTARDQWSPVVNTQRLSTPTITGTPPQGGVFAPQLTSEDEGMKQQFSHSTIQRVNITS